jgi:peptidoglycan biosynthesis protein MviN/MurJ (putative lipid II flippase)
MNINFQLGIVNLVNLIVSFLFNWSIFTFLGPSNETDALFAGMTIPQFFISIIGGSIIHVLVPALAGEKEEYIGRQTFSFIFFALYLSVTLAILMLFAANLIVPCIAPGFSIHSILLTEKIFKIQLIYMVFSIVNNVYFAAYYAREKFLKIDLINLILNLISLMLLPYMLQNYGVISAAWISSIRVVFQSIFLTFDINFFKFFKFKELAFKSNWIKVKPLIISAAYYKTDIIVDRMLLSTTFSGSLSLYYLAIQFYSSASQILDKSFTSLVIPKLSIFIKNNNYILLKKTYENKLIQLAFMSFFFVIGFLLFGQRTLVIFIGYGNVTNENISDLWLIMLCLSGMFVGGVMAQISSSLFYALNYFSTITKISVVTYTLYTVLKIVSFHFFGIYGLALSYSIYSLSDLFFQFIFLKNKLK